MKRIMVRFLTVAVAVFATLAFTLPEVEARRLGGGKSFGRQSSTITQRDAAKPPQQQAAPQAPARGAAAPGGNRWLAPIAGLAAGLGLAALASYLGFGEEMATMMMLALLALVAFGLFRMFAARRNAAGPRPAYPGGYSPGQVGQEASVRFSPTRGGEPARGVDAHVPFSGAASGAPDAGTATALRIPEGFDVEGFVRNAKVQFVRLQAVFDAGDLADLREFTTPEAYAELAMQIGERGEAANRTDVVTLDAQLLGIESSADVHVASVRFSGMIREDAGSEAKPFDEVWNLVKPVSGPGGWVLGGIQQLD